MLGLLDLFVCGEVACLMQGRGGLNTGSHDGWLFVLVVCIYYRLDCVFEKDKMTLKVG